MANNPNNTKMKGLLKGLRYISQIFDDNKDREMQIGFPTDVKHVAHIGWDGPSTAASSPSWMNEFQGPPGADGESATTTKEDAGVKWVSEGRTGSKGNGSPARNMPDVPKASRRQPPTGLGGNASGSPKREKSEKPKQTRRSSKPRDTSDSNTSGHRHSLDSALVGEAPQNLPDVPKKTRRKKSKDGTTSSNGGGSSRRSKSHTNSDSCPSPGHQTATTTMSKCNGNEQSQNSFQEGGRKGFT